MFYEEIVHRHFKNPLNVGNINNPTHTAMVGNPNSGAVVKLTAFVEEGIIKDIAFKAYGGGAMIASMSILTQKVKGMSISTALKITPNELSNELHLEAVKLIYAIVAIDALHKLFNHTS